MTWDLNLSPLVLQAAGAVQQKRTALHPAKLPAVQALRPDDVEQLAHLLLRVGEQWERQRLLRRELIVRGHGVARDADDVRSGLPEGGQQIAEILRFARATGSHVARIEIDDEPAAERVLEPP